MSFLENKLFLVTGLISNRSISYGIADALHKQGAKLAFTFQDERFRSRIEAMAADWGSDIAIQCDVTRDEDIENVFKTLGAKWDGLDGIIHSIAYAPADQLEGEYIDVVNREGFRIAHEISSYSFAALAKQGLPMMENRDAALLTMTYLGAEKAVPYYNVMGVAKASLEANVRYMASSLGPRGIRVNAISSGPIKTLAASGIKSFKKMFAHNEKITPLRRNVTLENVGNTAAFLCSDMAAGITGEIVHVDSGFHIIAMGDLE